MSAVKTLCDAITKQSQSDKTITYIEGKENETTISYKQLYDRALRALYVLQEKGLKPGDELIIFLRNNELFLDVFWAAVLGGIVPVPVAVMSPDTCIPAVGLVVSEIPYPTLIPVATASSPAFVKDIAPWESE